MRPPLFVTGCALGFIVGCAASEPSKWRGDVLDRTPDAELDGACEAACANLRSEVVRCPEGFGSVGGVSCTQVCVSRALRGPTPIQCWAEAKSAEEARACGSLRCVK